MNFNFYEQYESYPTVELLKIVQNQADYQPEAIAAANKLLAERTVSDTEHAEAQAYIDDMTAAKQRKKDIANLYKEKAVDILEPIIQPSTELQPEKWLRLFLLAVTIQYLFTAYHNVVYILWFSKCDTCSFDLTIFFSIFDLLFFPLLLWLLYKRKKLGWILLLINNLLIVMYALFSIPSLFYYTYVYHHSNIVSYLVTPLISAAFLTFLLKQKVADLFSVSKAVKKKTLIYTIVFGTISIGLLLIATIR